MNQNNQNYGWNRHSSQNQGKPNQQPRQTQTTYNFKFWEDLQKTIINKKLFSEEAKKIADILNLSKKDDKNKNKPTQIRKFYDEILKYKTLIKDENDFKNIMHI
jgi:CRISPR/Cas system CSM-associated protein Csm2 small subunit